MEQLLYLCIIIFAGLLGSKIIRLIKLPNVTGYLIAGLIIGPSLLKIVPLEMAHSLGFLSEIALGFIAFSIGCEFKVSYFKRVGFTPIVIAILEASMAVICVTTTLILFGFEIPFAIVLGSIAAATAPAATIMVVKQYHAKGKVTETLLSVVALDDAVALICFGIATAVAKMFLNPNGASIITQIMHPLIEIGLSLLVGLILGFIFTILINYYKSEGNRLSLLYIFIFLGIALSAKLGLSNLLTCMAMGIILTNFSSRVINIMKIQDQITPPIFLIFFVLSGAEFDVHVLSTIGIVGVIYFVLRIVGKSFGAYLGARIMHADEAVQKYLGLTLLPQAGVAIGLNLAAQRIIPEYAATLSAVILSSTLLYAIIGPIFSKMALIKAHEIIE